MNPCQEDEESHEEPGLIYSWWIQVYRMDLWTFSTLEYNMYMTFHSIVSFIRNIYVVHQTSWITSPWITYKTAGWGDFSAMPTYDRIFFLLYFPVLVNEITSLKFCKAKCEASKTASQLIHHIIHVSLPSHSFGWPQCLLIPTDPQSEEFFLRKYSLHSMFKRLIHGQSPLHPINSFSKYCWSAT